MNQLSQRQDLCFHFDPDSVLIPIFVSPGPLPRKESDTKVCFGLHVSTVDTEWSACATSDPSRNTVCVTISSSPNAPIGVYSLTMDQEGQKTSLGQFTLLFNAWCPREYSRHFFSPNHLRFCLCSGLNFSLYQFKLVLHLQLVFIPSSWSICIISKTKLKYLQQPQNICQMLSDVTY